MNRLPRLSLAVAVVSMLGFGFGLSDGAQAEEAGTQSAQAKPGAQADTPDSHRISRYLMQKFGVAKDKAEQIAKAVGVASEKYALPPALLLAIISIESRFKEKAKGANGATGLMQVVPAAHRNLLKNVKDLTQPDANIEAGSAILYGYRRSAGGDLTAALKSYGGSLAYAQKVTKRVEAFEDVVGDGSSSEAAGSAATGFGTDREACDARWTDFCIGQVVWRGANAGPSGIRPAVDIANPPGGAATLSTP